MEWARMLAYITGTVDQELLLRNEYLAAENRILKAQLKGRLLLTEAKRATLGEIGHRLGRKALEEVAAAAKPETILGWYRRLIARKFDGSKRRRLPGRPRGRSPHRRPGGALGPGEPQLGLRSHRRSAGEFGHHRGGSNGRQYPPPPRYPAGPEARARNNLERLHSRAPGGRRRHRLFHRGGRHAARAGHLLRPNSLSTWKVARSSWPG